ncbi:cupin domain-containing protein [Thalassotalea agariperforans]
MKILKQLAILTLLLISNNLLANDIINTAVVSQKQAVTQHFDWGTLITYYQGETVITKDALAAVAIINPGMEIHPPHVHEEEEYLMILEGSGTWTLHDQDFAAKAGDMLFSKPGDLHGLKNTGTTPLKFAVFKWNSKLVQLTAK